MLQLAIPIPSLPGTQDIDIEMTINGQKQKMHFKVELYQWDDCKSPEENRIDCIRKLVKDYGEEWMVYHIGLPSENYIPMTFVKTSDWERQRKLMMEAVLGG
jgi:hypothetical protein